MKIYIVQELNQYSVYKVADHLLESFQKEKGENVVVEGKSISEAINKFALFDKLPECEFNSQIIKYKTSLSEKNEEEKIRHTHKIKL